MRVFAALPLPPTAVRAIEESTSALKRRHPRLRTAGAPGMHITVHFFGELDARAVEDLAALWDRRELEAPAVAASLGALGQFPERGAPRVIWIGIDKGRDGLRELYDAFQGGISRLGYREDPRGFNPHITLARNGEGILGRDWFDGLPAPKADFTFAELVLYQSVLTPAGAHYTALRTAVLKGGAA